MRPLASISRSLGLFSFLPLSVIGENGDGSVFLGSCDAAISAVAVVFSRKQASLQVEGQAGGAPGGSAKHFRPPAEHSTAASGLQAHDAVVHNVGEIDASVLGIHRTLGERQDDDCLELGSG